MEPRETKRKLVHAGMGLFALLLRWLDWKTAAALAAAALLFNLFVMPRIGRGIYRDATKPRDPGIVAYPAMVLVLILLFRHELAAAAALWGMMAFGDPAATIAGTRLGGPRLPWNPKKTWAGLAAYAAVGTAAAVAFWEWVWPGPTSTLPLLPALLAAAVLLGAFLESLDTGIDDNWIPAIPCALLFAFEYRWMLVPWRWGELPSHPWLLALAVNVLVAGVTLALGVVSRSGAIAGALVGILVLAFGGWPQYAVLWSFFVLGTAATRLGYRRKEERRTAQAAQGRRGARHVAANCGVAALLCVAANFALPGEPVRALSIAFAAALAAALADTLGTELGSLYGRHPVSLASFHRVAPGTAGAVSAVGLLGGLLGAAAIGAVAAAVGLLSWSALWIVAAAGVAGSLAESLLADGVRRRGGRIDHEFANAFNTFVGAIVALEIAASLHLGRLSLPFELPS